MQQEFRFETLLFHASELTVQIMMASQTILRKGGKVDDADKNSFVTYELMVEANRLASAYLYF
jgi:hypothetical protein